TGEAVSLPFRVYIEPVGGVPVCVRLDAIEEAPLTVPRDIAEISQSEIADPFTPQEAVDPHLVHEGAIFRLGEHLCDPLPPGKIPLIPGQFVLERFVEGGDPVEVLLGHSFLPLFRALFLHLVYDGEQECRRFSSGTGLFFIHHGVGQLPADPVFLRQSGDFPAPGTDGGLMRGRDSGKSLSMTGKRSGKEGNTPENEEQVVHWYSLRKCLAMS